MKSFISKEMIDALKLTRNHTVTLYSPLAMYMNSKGSLSWEASVKSKSYVPEADVVPSGWRIVSQENLGPQQSTSDTKKTPGGFLSFFGRKTASTALSGSSPSIRPTSPVVISPRASIVSRASTDVDNSIPVVPKTIISPSTDARRSATMSALAEFSTISKIDASTLSSEAEVPVRAPSAVSRFFSRFSRSNRSSASSSLALSTDDLQFLSDIVPSAHDGTGDIDQPSMLSSAIRAPHIPEKLPLPLVPPPRAPSLPGRFISSPSVNLRPSNQASFNSHSDSVVGFIESPPSPDFSQQQSRPSSQISLRAIPPTQASGSSGLQPPLSPSTAPWNPANRSSGASVPTKSSLSLFNDGRFSDFQVSPGNSSVPLMSSMSSNFSFGSFVNSTEPIESLQIHDQSVSFDDFDDFVSSPPKVPEKPSSVPLPRLIPPPTQPAPSINPVSPTRQASSPRQAESDQRTLNLLESAATRGVWPAPPSPLPNPIPPPTTSKSTGNNLFDTFDEPSGSSTDNLNGPDIVSSLLSLSGSSPSPALSAAPSLPETVVSTNTVDMITSGNGPGLNGMRSLPPLAPPPNPPTKSILLLTQFQMQHDQKMQPQLLWRDSMHAKPLSSCAQPTSSSSSFTFGYGESLSPNGSNSGTPSQQHPQQQTPEPGALFNTTTAPAPSYLHSEISPSQNPSSNGGKLSAQDLSFFERL